jgi:ABC-type lipoprotein release transport system permease subunit
VFNRDRVKQSEFTDFSYPAYVDPRDRSGVFDGLLAHSFTTIGIRDGLSALLYRVSPLDPLVMTIAALVLSTAAMLACYFPARRATRIVPLEALRSE